MASVKVLIPFVTDTGVAALEWTSPHVTADVFTPGILTITHDATGDVIQTFPVDGWLRATVYGSDGYEVFTLTNQPVAA